MRRVYLFGEVCNERAEKFITQLHELFEESQDPVTVFVNSCGGSVTDALAIYDVLQNAPCDIHTVGLGKVHSAAVTVMLAAPAENRSAYPNTEFMSHDISWKSDGPRSFLRDRVEQLERTVDQLLRVYTRDTFLSDDEARRMFFTDTADHYFTADQARAMGFISRVISNEKERPRAAVRAGLAAQESMNSPVLAEDGTVVNSSNKD